MEKQFDICPKCGLENVTESAWCERCLTPFDYHEQRTLSCPECGYVNDYQNEYCESCNEPLKPGQWE